jgi:hypothetical protein
MSEETCSEDDLEPDDGCFSCPPEEAEKFDKEAKQMSWVSRINWTIGLSI